MSKAAQTADIDLIPDLSPPTTTNPAFMVS
jgi:hypothetical protein